MSDRSARATSRRLLGLEARLLVSLIAIGLLGVLFAKVASEVLEGDTLAWDRAILLDLRQPNDLSEPIGPWWLQKWLKDITALGGVSVMTIDQSLDFRIDHCIEVAPSFQGPLSTPSRP